LGIALCLLLAWSAAFPGQAYAFDYGLIISTEPGYSSPEGEGFFFNNSLSPWLSAPLGSKAKLYLSLKASLDYERKEWDLPMLLELGRTEFTYRLSPAISFALGRQNFKDSAGLIADGLYDGLSGSFVLGKTRLSAGAYYTGFLYKETAEILMTGNDYALYSRKLDYSDFSDTYFASRSIVAAVRSEFPDLISKSLLAFDVIAQFDLNTIDDDSLTPQKINSQYIEAQYLYELTPAINLHAVIAAGLAELDDTVETKNLFSFAAKGGADWKPPTALRDLLAVQLTYASSAGTGADSKTGSFTPVNNVTAGEIYTPAIAGTLSIQGKYSVRLLETLSAEGSAFYFINTAPDIDSRLLGGELFGNLIWAPDPDIRLNLKGGAFFPQLGNALPSDESIRWQIGLGLTISL
jgi:hypothetical protein